MSQEATNITAGEQNTKRVRVAHFTSVFGWAVAIAMFFYFFRSLRLVSLGLLAAGTMAAALRPVRDRIPGPRPLGAIAAGIVPLLVLGGLIALLSWLLADRLRSEWQDWPAIQQRINNKLADWSGRFGMQQPLTVQSFVDQGREFLTAGGGQQVLSTTANVISGILIALVFVFFGSVYLLAERDGRLMAALQRLLPPGRRPELKGAVDDLEPRLRWWLIGTLISMAVVGLLSWIGFSIAGLEFALALALLVGFAEIVPTVGPAVAFLVTLLFAVTQGTGVVVGVVIVYVVVQTLESYVLLPMVMKRRFTFRRSSR